MDEQDGKRKISLRVVKDGEEKLEGLLSESIERKKSRSRFVSDIEKFCDQLDKQIEVIINS